MKAIRVTMVVNRPGIQSRRAEALAARLSPRFDVEVIVEPTFRAALAAASRADIVYVIDLGRHGTLGYLAARLRRRPVVVEVGDVASALYRAMGRGQFAVAAGVAIDRIGSRRPDGVVVRWRECADILGVTVPWIEIPDGVDPSVFSSRPQNGLREHYGIPNDALVVGLVGSMTPSRGVGLTYGWDVVEALAELDDVRVWGLLVGGGEGLDRIRRRAQEVGVEERLVLTGSVEHRDVPEHICSMDVAVSTQTNDAVGRSRTTSKLPEYLACDRFVIASAVGAAAVVLPDEMLLPYEGTVDRSYPEKLAGKLGALIPKRSELRNGVGTRRIALEHYDYDDLAHRLGVFLLEVLG